MFLNYSRKNYNKVKIIPLIHLKWQNKPVHFSKTSSKKSSITKAMQYFIIVLTKATSFL